MATHGLPRGFDAKAMRAASTRTLAEAGLRPPPASLPTLREVYKGKGRSAREVVDRIRALTLIFRVCFAERPADKAADVSTLLARRGLMPFVSAAEAQMLAGEGSAPEISWRIECQYALGWALGIFPDLPLTGMYEGGPEEFVTAGLDADAGTPAPLVLRPKVEIVRMLDCFYCAHNAVVSFRLGQGTRPWPEAIVQDAVWERRHALEWVLSREAWDDIVLHT